MALETVGSPLLWVGFTLLVLTMLVLDLGVFHRRAKEVTFKEAVSWTVVWVSLALAFNVGVYFWFGPQKALEFFTGYLIEESLSVDNLFVFLVIFSYFGVPKAYQHHVLFWGILGALVMRAIFIIIGAALIQKFHWVIYVFGALLVVTGIKLLFHQNAEFHPEKNLIYRFFRKMFPTISHYEGQRFFVIREGRRYATPLFLVLIAVETSDLFFAVDSIPAIFAVTTDPFIVYTSNVFAILGLRSLFFVLARIMDKFHFLQIGLAVVLTFVGVKMLLTDMVHIPIAISLGVVASVLALSMIASILFPRPVDLPIPLEELDDLPLNVEPPGEAGLRDELREELDRGDRD